jgi:hypothetical protein
MMSTENAFNVTNRDHKLEDPRAVLHERRTKKGGTFIQNEKLGANPAPAPAVTTASRGSRGYRVSLGVFVGARLFGGSLDDKLAEGCAPETSRLLATRSQLIVSPTMRRKLADNWLDLLAPAHEPAGFLNPRIPLVFDRIVAAQPQIQELADALLAPMPTSRGVAMARSLLSDGSGPIYNSACSTDLGLALREVIARLNPLTA